MAKNFEALGRYTANKEQALDAYARRFSMLHNLGGDLMRNADTTEPIDFARIRDQVEKAAEAQRVMLAALEEANNAAAAAEQLPISVATLANKRALG